MAALLPYLLTTVKDVDLQKVPASDMQNLKTLSQHTECGWQVFSSLLRQFHATDSDAIISKTRDFF